MRGYQSLMRPIMRFLHCPTPQAWIDKASLPEHLPVILIDHLLCELKAAQSAMLLIRKYASDQNSSQALLEWFKPYEDFAYRGIGGLDSFKDHRLSRDIIANNGSSYSQELIDKMILLIKEELHHFYQVLEIISERGINYRPIPAGRYAKGLISHMRTFEPQTLVDKLIIGAFIEARSCERFYALAPHVDEELRRFYVSLLRSEARHYQDYLTLAQSISKEDISSRVKEFGEIEKGLITTIDSDFKFHSGVPDST